MRYVSFVITVLVLLVVAVPPAHADDARASEVSKFKEWALKKGEGFDTEWNQELIRKQRTDLDKRWNAIAVSKESRSRAVRTIGPGYKSTGTSRTYYSRPKANRGQWTVSGSQFIHKGNPEFLPLSTKTRSGPSRGTNSLRNPAQASRGYARDFRRTVRSSTKIRNIFGPQRSVSRPKLKSNRRISKSSRRRRSVSRPRHRADRPKGSR